MKGHFGLAPQPVGSMQKKGVLPLPGLLGKVKGGITGLVSTPRVDSGQSSPTAAAKGSVDHDIPAKYKDTGPEFYSFARSPRRGAGSPRSSRSPRSAGRHHSDHRVPVAQAADTPRSVAGMEFDGTAAERLLKEAWVSRQKWQQMALAPPTPIGAPGGGGAPPSPTHAHLSSSNSHQPPSSSSTPLPAGNTSSLHTPSLMHHEPLQVFTSAVSPPPPSLMPTSSLMTVDGQFLEFDKSLDHAPTSRR